MLDKNRTQSGFVLLTTVIVLVAVLLVVVSSSAAAGWHLRKSVLEREYEVIASGWAESCLQITALRLSMSIDVHNGEIIIDLPGSGFCTVVGVIAQGSDFLVTSEASYNGAVIKYQALVSGTDFGISRVRLMQN